MASLSPLLREATLVSLCLPLIAGVAAAAAEDASPAAKTRGRVARRLKQLAAEVDKRVPGHRVGLVAVPLEGATDASADPNRLVLEALLAESVLVVPLADDKRLPSRDERGEFSLKALLGDKGVGYLRGTLGLHFLAVSRAQVSGGKGSVAFELFDLAKAKVLTKATLPLFDRAAEESAEGIELLPPMNVKVMVHATENLGKQVGKGECWDLPAVPLKEAGFRVSGYEFGTKVPWSEALPGDVITIDNGQFRHVMVLLRPGKTPKQAKILHQNWDQQRVVIRGVLPGTYPLEDVVLWRPGVRKK